MTDRIAPRVQPRCAGCVGGCHDQAFGVIPTFGEGPSGRTFVVVNSELMELSAPVPAVPALPGLAPWALAAALAYGALRARFPVRRRAR
jgi:hypothetical protein